MTASRTAPLSARTILGKPFLEKDGTTGWSDSDERLSLFVPLSFFFSCPFLVVKWPVVLDSAVHYLQRMTWHPSSQGRCLRSLAKKDYC